MSFINVYDLRCEYKKNPIGIDVKKPRLSWKLDSLERNVIQAGYQIQVFTENDLLNPIWDTGKVNSDQSIHIEYNGPSLISRTRYCFKVRVWCTRGHVSDWSERAFWETAFLHSSEWEAKWISISSNKSKHQEPCHYFRKSFKLSGIVKSAKAYATAHGLYQLFVNGEKADNTLFTPGWTSYNKRLQYQTYDITNLLSNQENALGVMLADGWYKGNLAWQGHREHFGDKRSFLLQIHLIYEGGLEEIITTDESWKWNSGPLLMTELYHGETFDARLEKKSWNLPNFDESSWWNVTTLNDGYETLVAQENDPTRIIQELKPIKVLSTPEGDTVLDMGQNMVGWVRFQVNAKSGTIIKLQHAEVLDQNGNFYIGNLRSAKQTITYICNGEGTETFEPYFSFQGFRYVRVEGFPNDDLLERFTGCVIHTDMERTGTFSCSDEMINQLQHNIVWGQKGNFLDVPTDCPQRDERLGWTGDAQVFIRTAAFNYHIGPFFEKWLKDLAADQRPDGAVPYIIPNLPAIDFSSTEYPMDGYASAAWGDAAVICPWTIYEIYGDTRILENQYPSMKAWVEYIRSQGDDEYLWNTGEHYGDWVALDAKENSYAGATPKDLIATAFYAYSTGLLAKSAAILGKHDEAEKYLELKKNIVNAFRNEFVTPNGRVASPTQTAYLLALMFDLLEEKDRARTANMLATHIEQNGTHLTTGFVGTPYLCLVLSRFGYTDLAYRLVLQKDYPSWLYSVTKGATTIWEHWDGIKSDGTFWSDDMNSFNHYAYGSIGEWFYRMVAGIDTDENQPGYKYIRINPYICEQLTNASAQFSSMYGEIKSSWERGENGRIKLSVTIPANTEAEVILKANNEVEITESGKRLSEIDGIRSLNSIDNSTLIKIGSGTYHFEYQLEETIFQKQVGQSHKIPSILN